MAAVSMSNRRMLVSCFLGTTIEWYDFLVYGFLAPLALNRLFFPSLSPAAGTILRRYADIKDNTELTVRLTPNGNQQVQTQTIVILHRLSGVDDMLPKQ